MYKNTSAFFIASVVFIAFFSFYNLHSSNADAPSFACNIGTLDTECVVNSVQAIGDGEIINGTGNITIANGGNLSTNNLQSFTINLTGPSSTLTIENGGNISGNVTVNAVNIDIQSGGNINANGKGYTGHNTASTAGQPAIGGGGKPTSSGDGGGGGHGGNGGRGKDGIPAGSGGEAFGSITEPLSYGSSGGTGNTTANTSGSGGGLIVIRVSNSLIINGNLTANGTNVTGTSVIGAGGGSGGSINIEANSIDGAGTLTANGGNGSALTDGGGGGGGRIKIIFNTLEPTLAFEPVAYGGNGYQIAGAGTIYLKDENQQEEILMVINDLINPNIPSNVTPLTSDNSFDNISISGGAIFQVPENSTLNAYDFDPPDVLSELRVEGNFSGPQDLSVPENLVFRIEDTAMLANIGTLIVEQGGTLVLDSFTSTAFDDVDNYLIKGTLTHAANETTEAHILNISATNMTISDTGIINLEGKGYAGQKGVRLTGNPAVGGGGAGSATSGSDGGGGGHGGTGGAGKDGSPPGAGGPEYDSLADPVNIGSSGGTGQATTITGGSGGGAALVSLSGTLDVQGAINASGTSGISTSVVGAGGGAGGAINIRANTINGGGSLLSNGGEGSKSSGVYHGGGGAGGRIMLQACTFSHSGTRTSSGSAGGNNGNNGTIELAPTCANSLQSNNDDTSTGQQNPTGLTDTTPAFSAICNDPDSEDILNMAQIQVTTDANFNQITHWDSGSNGNAITNCTAGTRSQDIIYGNFGDSPSQTLTTNDGSITYYWRIRFWDDDGGMGAWSTETASFAMADEAGELAIGILDEENIPVGSPTISLSSTGYDANSSSTTTGVFPAQSQKIHIENNSGNSTWTLTVAPSNGTSALWQGTSGGFMDYNDANDGSDGDYDGYGGQLYVNPLVATLTGMEGTSTSGLSKGNPVAFGAESITVLSANENASAMGKWELSGISLEQLVPAQTPADVYTLELTLTIL